LQAALEWTSNRPAIGPRPTTVERQFSGVEPR
jgi:hypothetical protein